MHAPAVNLTELKKTTALREKMEVMREKRRMNQLLGYSLLFACVIVYTMKVLLILYSVQAFELELILIPKQSAGL